MRRLINAAGLFLISVITGGLYAVVIGLFYSPFRAPVIAWPILATLFWFIFWKFKVLRFVGFIWVLPGALIGFELYWSASHPGMVADQYMAPDRSHYIPARVKAFRAAHNVADMFGAGLTEAFFGSDGFRADPQTGKGNPERCQFVLIGDSMVYGSGLPYQYTFGPVLAEMGIHACVFGVTGNSPVDYLATARYVADRIDAGAHVAFYLYAYNDFVDLNQYISRGVLSLSNRFTRLFAWVWEFDRWRQGTLTFARFAASPSTRDDRRCLDCGPGEHGSMWQYDVGKAEPIKVLYPRDPAQYEQPKPLNSRQRTALQFFFKDVGELARGRAWRVTIVIHPDESEFYANLARHTSAFVDLDPRRAEALKICQDYRFLCADISHYIYRRALEEGKNPYFIDNRHFSIAGTRMVAESFVAQAKESSQSEQERVNAASLRRFP
jgi:hypothetical protein